MKNKELLSLAYDLAAPIGLIVIGLVLVVAPDAGTVLLSRLLGGLLSLAGCGLLLGAIFWPQGRIKKILLWLACMSMGSFLLANPLALAAFAGRILGILIALRGIRELLRSVTSAGRVLSAALAIAGILLTVLPMSISRLVFFGCGLVLLADGAYLLAAKLRQRRYLDSGCDDIIDAL